MLPSISQAGDTRPNIIFIITDDIGWTDWRPYNGQSKLQLPNIEKLAREGMRFSDAHSTSALCAPSRYSLLTGNYAWRGLKPGGSWLWFADPQILPNQQTIGNILQSAGYRTGIIGKLHIGAEFEWKTDYEVDFTQPLKQGPRQWGFDYSYVLLAGHQNPPYLFFENNHVDGDPALISTLPAVMQGDQSILPEGPGLPGWQLESISQRLLDKSVHFIQSTRGKPFYLHLSTPAAHTPLAVPAAINGIPVAGKTGISPRADMIYSVDVIVGQLLKTLRDTGQLDNTLIVVTSDNGGSSDDAKTVDTAVPEQDANRDLKGEKAYIWEGGHRVPLIAWWPGHIPPNTLRLQLVGNHDMIATFANIARARYGARQIRDGISLLPVLLNEQSDNNPVRQDLLIDSGIGRNAFTLHEPSRKQIENLAGEQPETLHTWQMAIQQAANNLKRFFSRQDLDSVDKKPVFDFWFSMAEKGKLSGSDGMAHALRVGPWKLVFDIEHDKPVALYNLTQDLGENNNLINTRAQRKRIANMTERYRLIRRTQRSVAYPDAAHTP